MMLELAIAPSLDDLAYVSDALEDSLLREGLPPERIGQVRLIVEELGCNALLHGQCDEQPLRVQLQVDAQALVLELRDPGDAFDPCAVPAPDLDADLDTRAIGGLGLFLVNQFADHIVYRRDGAYNIVRVTLLHPYAPVPRDPVMTTLAIHIDPAQDTRQRVILTGRLDTHTYQDLEAALSPLLGTTIATLVLDLTALEYISSAGIRVIFKARKTLATRQGKVLVTNPQPQIRKVFDMVKAVPLSDVFASTEELDAYLAAMQRKVIEQHADGDNPILPHFAKA